MVKPSKRQTRKVKGGGWSIGDSLSKDAYYVPEYKPTDDCAVAQRPGFIQAIPNPELAQTRMAGAGRIEASCAPSMPIGSIQSNPRPNLAQTPMAGGGCNCTMKMRGGGCGMKMRGGGCGMKMRGGGCGMKMRGGGCGMKMRGGGCGMKMRGGTRKGSRRSRKTLKGGRYVIDTNQSIGGDGPNVAPIYSSVPCEAHRAMPLNPTLPTLLADSPVPDVNVSGLKPAFIMKGGDFSSGHPLAYTAPRAGFSFTPNITQGQKLDPGQIPYEEVIPQTDPCTTATCGTAMASISR
jgi:hypothetical protein